MAHASRWRMAPRRRLARSSTSACQLKCCRTIPISTRWYRGSLSTGSTTAAPSTNAKGAVFYDLTPLPELAETRHAVYVAGKKVLSHDYLKQLTPLSLAIWYMDDGSFSLRAKGLQERTREDSGRSEICVEA